MAQTIILNNKIKNIFDKITYDTNTKLPAVGTTPDK